MGAKNVSQSDFSALNESTIAFGSLPRNHRTPDLIRDLVFIVFYISTLVGMNKSAKDSEIVRSIIGAPLIAETSPQQYLVCNAESWPQAPKEDAH